MSKSAGAALAEIFGAVAPRLSEELVGAEERAQVATLCQRIAVEAEAGLEVRLAKAERVVDFGWCAHSPRRLETWREMVAADTGEIAESPRWARLVRHLEGLDWHQAVQSMWFEFDLGPLVGRLPVPGIFVRYAAGHDAAWQRLARDAAGISPSVVEAISAQLAILQKHARVSYFGFLLSRPVEAMRVVCLAAPQQVRAALEELGWAGDHGGLAALDEGLEELGTQLVWQVDLGREVFEKVSLEIFLEGKHHERMGKAGRLLERWVAQGLCSTAKAKALLSWEGVVREKQAGPRWPRHLKGTASEDGSFSFLSCTVNHLKLSLAARGGQEAKAYLSFREERYSPRGVMREDSYAPQS